LPVSKTICTASALNCGLNRRRCSGTGASSQEGGPVQDPWYTPNRPVSHPHHRHHRRPRHGGTSRSPPKDDVFGELDTDGNRRPYDRHPSRKPPTEEEEQALDECFGIVRQVGASTSTSSGA